MAERVAEVVREETGFIIDGEIRSPGNYKVLPGAYAYKAVAKNTGTTSSTIWVARVQNYRVLDVVSDVVPPGGTISLTGYVVLFEGETSSYVFYVGHGTPPAEGQMIYVSGYDDYYGYWTLKAEKKTEEEKKGVPLWVILLGLSLVFGIGLALLRRS